jgi:mannose-6-phosphate isomerase-like protein (cupin superfamily)
MLTHYDRCSPYITKDGSEIRELMHPASHGNAKQSLAEAVIATGESTQLHRHIKSEEIYHITQGIGVMTLGNQTFEIKAGDTVCIDPGVAHRAENTGKDPLHILCCCSPAYDHEDTELLK